MCRWKRNLEIPYLSALIWPLVIREILSFTKQDQIIKKKTYEGNLLSIELSFCRCRPSKPSRQWSCWTRSSNSLSSRWPFKFFSYIKYIIIFLLLVIIGFNSHLSSRIKVKVALNVQSANCVDERCRRIYGAYSWSGWRRADASDLACELEFGFSILFWHHFHHSRNEFHVHHVVECSEM